MRKWKSNLDERQEQELLRIEHNGYWLAFFGLLAAMLIQQIFFEADFREIAGEWILLMVVAIYMVGACMKHGIWDRHLKANMKTNFLVSLAAAAVTGIFTVVLSIYRFSAPAQIWILGFVISAASVFLLCFIILQILSGSYRRKQEKMEEEPQE